MAQEKENSIHEGCKPSPSRQNFYEFMAETLPESIFLPFLPGVMQGAAGLG